MCCGNTTLNTMFHSEKKSAYEYFKIYLNDIIQIEDIDILNYLL